MLSVKQKQTSKQQKQTNKIFAGFQPLPHTGEGMWRDKVGGRVHPLDRLAPAQYITDVVYSLGFSKTGFGDRKENLSFLKNRKTLLSLKTLFSNLLNKLPILQLSQQASQ